MVVVLFIAIRYGPSMYPRSKVWIELICPQGSWISHELGQPCGHPQDLQGGLPSRPSLFKIQIRWLWHRKRTWFVKGFPEMIFICVHEQFMTETAEMADVVLPATTFLEHDDCYSAGGHTFFQIAKAVVPPLGNVDQTTG